LLCAMDVASGMSHLHSMKIIHADLKPANVLLKSAHASADDPRGFTCKIADFGMARMLSADDSYISTETLGSLPYLAPEVLQLNKVTKAGDVYSFAVLLLEMWVGGGAYQDQNYHQVSFACKIVFCGLRPLVPADMPAAYRALLEDCWAADAKLRPTFDGIL
ncbi:kinase-like protein, partial [Coccomyxa subellipsoidea C-169]